MDHFAACRHSEEKLGTVSLESSQLTPHDDLACHADCRSDAVFDGAPTVTALRLLCSPDVEPSVKVPVNPASTAVVG